MPSTRYRRHLRNSNINGHSSNTYINIPNNLSLSIVNGQNTIVDTINQTCLLQNNFFAIIDLIIKDENINTITNSITSIKDSLATKVKYMTILELIEKNILSLIGNISDSIEVPIICMRIDYIRSIIQQLPTDICCGDCTTISNMILQLIYHITTSLDMNILTPMATIIHSEINSNCDITVYNLVKEIQELLLGIITNIRDGIPADIICSRIDYVRSLIQLLPAC